jgi:hypothetical protein
VEENISVGVLPPLAMFKCKSLFPEMDPVDCLPFQVYDIRETGRGGDFDVHMEFLSMQIFLEVFHRLHNSQ